MKYNSSNKPLVCMQTQSNCYKNTSDKNMKIKGVLWHSTGAANPALKRYVQPSDTTPKEDTYSKEIWLSKLGKNNNKNDWNHTSVQAGLNCWIGKLADGTVTTVQTMPWNYKPWGCGSAYEGGPSCNNGWIQFEICEPSSLADEEYFNAVYKEACELTAYLCKLYNINPNGKATHTSSGKKVPTILCHKDAHSLGLGSNHGDVLHWFDKHGKTMDDVRRDVAALLKGEPVSEWDSSSESSASSNDSTENGAQDELFLETTADLLIRNLSVSKISATNAEIALSVSDAFTNYSWQYSLTVLAKKDITSNKTVSIKSKKTNIGLTELVPNTGYSLELIAEDKFKNKIKSPAIIFCTEPDYPEAVRNLKFTYSLGKISFDAPNSWGAFSKYSNYTCGYRVSIIINGKEIIYDDDIIGNKSNKIESTITKLFSKINLICGDVVQVGILPWVADENGNKTFSNFKAKCTKPVHITNQRIPIDKFFVSVDNAYNRAILYSIK